MTPRPIVFRGGRVIDGTGAPSRAADLLVDDGTIAAIGPDLVAPDDALVIDVTGSVVTPGFIDLHSHADFSLLAFPTADSAIRQGVTTVCTGNCGGGVAPISSPGSVGDVAFAYHPRWDVDVDWTDFASWTGRLDGTAINVAPLVAHGVIRNLVMGAADRAPSDDELRSMRDEVTQAMDQGAFGMSTGLEYRPGMWATLDELRTLVAVVGRYDRMYATHMRGRAEEHATATREAIATVEGSGARLQLSHFAPRPHAPVATKDAAFDAVERARERGVPVGVDTFPEEWGPGLLIDLFPPWVFEGHVGDVLRRLTDRSVRAELSDRFVSDPSFLARVAGYDRIIVSNPVQADFGGMFLGDIARTLQVTVAEAACDLLAEAGSEYRSIAIQHVYATPEDLARTLSLDCCAIESDGVVTTGEGPDCGMVWNASTYGFTARTLHHHVRDTGLFTLEEAVRRLTSLPADALGVADRGRLQSGARADVVVLDPERITDRAAEHDVARHPTGISHVLVNGELAMRDGRQTDARAGRLLVPA